MEAKQAANIASIYLSELVPQADEVLLEEVEEGDTEGKNEWLITLSFNLPMSSESSMQALQNAMNGRRRKYKTFRIDRGTGKVLSMKIRELA